MAWSYIQSTDYTATGSQTQSFAFPSPTTINSLVVMSYAYQGSNVIVDAVYDNVGNTYTIHPYSASYTTGRTWLAYGVQTIPNATTWSINLSVDLIGRACMGEFAGGMNTNAAVFDTASVSKTNVITLPFSASISDNLTISSRYLSGNSNYTASSGFTLFNIGNQVGLGMQYNLTGSIVVPVSAMITSSATNNSSIISVFKPLQSTSTLKFMCWQFDD